MDKKFSFNVPNILSLYRLCIFPVIMWCIIAGLRNFFTVLFVISLVTDILDGFIARRFNLQTPIGARLDSLADIGTVILGVTGMFVFEYSSVEPYLLFLFVLVVLYIAVIIVSLVKFGSISSLHLYSSKVAAYLQGIFFFVLFCFGFSKMVFWVMFGMAAFSYAEEISILFTLRQLRNNAKGIYWVLKKNG